MLITNPIRYTLAQTSVPVNKLPQMVIESDGMAYGSIEIQLPLTGCVVTPSLYRLAPPTTDIDPWSRLQPELLQTYPSAVAFTSYIQSNGYFKITWQFDPSVVPSVFSGQFFDIEFSVNGAHDAAIASYTPKVIVEIFNEIDVTGVTGYAGITGLDSVYRGPLGDTGLAGATGLEGPTGAQGITGQIGFGGTTGAPGEQGITGQQGAQGVTGFGFTGTVGLTGSDGITGTIGLTGSIGDTGSIGITGEQGAPGLGTTGKQGETGAAGLGSTGLVGVTGLQNFYEVTTYTTPTIRPAIRIDLNRKRLAYWSDEVGHWVGWNVGAQAFTGPQGITGAQGLTGLIGITGAQGYTGKAGVTGLVGPTGMTGLTGAQGYTGPIGVTGFQGVTGLIGQTGSQGYTGFGLQGITGIQGVTGTVGSTGIGFTTDSINMMLESPICKTYTLDTSAPNNYRVQSFVAKMVGGTGVCNIYKNGVGISGLTKMWVGSTITGYTGFSPSNNVLVGDLVTMGYTGSGIPSDLSFTLRIDR